MRTRIHPKALGLSVAVAATLALSGCGEPSAPVIPTAQPSVVPVFATDADALAAAKKAYTGYLAASDEIGDEGGAHPERIAPWVTKSRIRVETNQFNALAKSGVHFVGDSTFSDFRLQDLTQSERGSVSLAAYVCDNVGNSRVIDANGTDVTPSDRKDLIPIQVQFRNLEAGASRLVVEGSTVWAGRDFCSR